MRIKLPIAATSSDSPATKYIQKVYRGLPINPNDEDQRLIRYQGGVVALQLIPLGYDLVELKWIAASPRGSGYGAMAIRWLQKLAEAFDPPIYIEGYPWASGPVAEQTLRKIYVGLGFVPIDRGRMLWTPSGGRPINMSGPQQVRLRNQAPSIDEAVVPAVIKLRGWNRPH